jgi:translocation and assembly module TamB
MTLQAQLQPFAANPVTQLHAILQQWNPGDFAANAPQAKLSVSAQLTQNEAGQLTGNIDIENHAPAPLDQGGIPLSAIHARALISSQLLALPEIRALSGKGGVVRGPLAWDWNKHTLTADLEVERIDPQQLDTRLQSTAISGKIELTGDADKQSARADLRSQSLRLTGQGKLQLTGEQMFDVSGALINFNSADFIQTADSSLNATLQASGQLLPAVSGTLNYAIHNSRLGKSPVNGSGEIAFTGTGRFSGKAEYWQVQTVCSRTAAWTANNTMSN